MFVRASIAAVALALALPAAAAAQGFEYAPNNAQYRIIQKQKITQDMMGQKQEFETSQNQVLSVTMARKNKDTVDVKVVLDSLSIMTPMGPAPDLGKLLGLTINAKMSPVGTVYSTAAVKADSLPSAAALADAMGTFLPRIKASLAPGASWTDTSTAKVKQMGIDVDRRVISKYTVLGDTSVAGEKNWKVGRESNTVMSGSGVANGQVMTMEGTSTGKGALLLSPKGIFFGGEGTEDATIKIVLAANGMEVGVTTTATTKIDKIK